MLENNAKDRKESIIRSKISEAKLDELFEMAVEMDVSGLDSFNEIKNTRDESFVNQQEEIKINTVSEISEAPIKKIDIEESAIREDVEKKKESLLGIIKKVYNTVRSFLSKQSNRENKTKLLDTVFSSNSNVNLVNEDDEKDCFYHFETPIISEINVKKSVQSKEKDFGR